MSDKDWSDILSSWQGQVSPVPALVASDIRKSKLKPEEAARGLRSLDYDPLAIQYAMGFKDRKYSVTYDVLKRIPHQVAVVAAILQTRCNQVASFSVPFRASKSVGYVIKHKDPSHLTTKGEQEFIKDLERFVYNCGYDAPNPYSNTKRDGFESFLKKIVRDSLVYDQTCIEVVPDRKGQPYEFMAVDASTIRLAAVDTPYGPNNTWMKRQDNYSGNPVGYNNATRNPYRALKLYEGTKYDKNADFVQIINGQIENVYDRDEMIFGVRNPRTDIYIQGYGYGELEQLVTVVTAHLYAEEYNRRFFCTPGHCLVATDQGTKKIEDLSGTSFKVWNGYDWREAKAFETGHRPLGKLTLKNNVVVETSPEHSFLTYRQSFGEPQWLELKDVKAGDHVLQNKTPVDNKIIHSELLLGKKYQSQRVWGNAFTPTKELVEDEEFWALMGFAIGDGSFQHKSGKLYIFPHYKKDKEVYELASRVLDKYNLNYKIAKTNKYVKRLDGQYGYESVLIQHKEFVSWLEEIGFRDSSEGKRIPESVFCLPLKYRRAFIRGLFSADGHSHRHPTGYKTPTVFSADSVLIQDIQQLLLTCGMSFIKTKGTELNISNVMDYSNDIGFIQSYKNVGYKRVNKDRWDSLPSQLSQDLAALIRANKDWSTLAKKDRDLVCKASRGKTRLSAPSVSSILEELKEAVPYYLSYHFSEVSKVDLQDLEVPMYDVEVFDDEHIFLANGVAVHNSQGSAPKGILNFKGDSMTPDMLEGFRRQWRANLEGVENSWRTPILQAENGLDWIDLHPTNRDMEYGSWLEYLIKITCFTENTPVVVEGGSQVPISEIVPGQLVFSHNGALRAVSNVQEKKYDGKLLHIRAGEVIETTPEHPFYVSSSKFDSTNRERVFDEPEWKTADQLVEGADYLLVPKKTYEYEGTTSFIDLTEHITSDFIEVDGKLKPAKSNRASWIPRKLPLTEGVSRLLGLYASEGNSTSTGVYFTFSSEEEELQSFVVDEFNKLGIYAAPYSSKDTTKSVRVTSKLLAEAFGSLLGHKALKKKIPQEISTTIRSNQKAFISGIIAGDGSVPAFASGAVTVTLSSVSNTLLEQLRHLLLQQDIYSRKYNDIKSSGFVGKPQYRLDVNGTQAVKLASWLVGTKGDSLRTRIANSKQIKSKVYESSSYFMVPISEIWSSEYSGIVYNLEVEGEHTYQVSRFAVHNCGVFLIDPAEINFDLKGGVQQTPLFESSQEWKLKASRDRGLKPLLRFIAKELNEYIISKIDDRFVFDFAGLEELTEQEKHTLRTEQVSSYLTLNEVRRSDDLPDLEHGDIPMNPTYLQAIQQKAAEEQQKQQMQQQQAVTDAQNAAADGGEENKGTGQGEADDGAEAPQYADSFGKSLVVSDGVKFLEIDLSELDTWKEGL